jgi:hypothetical protein
MRVRKSWQKAGGIVKKSGRGATLLILLDINPPACGIGCLTDEPRNYQITGSDLTPGDDLPIFPRDIGPRFRVGATADP